MAYLARHLDDTCLPQGLLLDSISCVALPLSRVET